MYQKLIKNDIKKSKLITITITVFILLAAFFTSLGVSSLVNLFAAIDNLMLDAKAPHYVQMHSGDVDVERLEKFAESHEAVEEWQLAEFLNIEGADILIGDYSLANSVDDNGFSIQNKELDFLLDLNNEIIDPKDGEIYVPIYFLKEGIAKLGDTVIAQDVSFTIAGFLHDSQMNSSLSGSKRFLVSEHDFERLRATGELEYLIEFRLHEGANIAAFESAYIQAGMEVNGPAGSYGLIKMMNGISDGILIALLLLVGILILIVSFLCVRFTLISKVEEDYREIGVLKAIGLRVSDIKKLYLAKYSIIAAVACGLGYLLSIFCQDLILANIQLYMGKSGKEHLGALLGVCGAVVIFFFVIFYVNRVLGRFRKISATQAIRNGAPVDKAKASKGLSLMNNRRGSTSAFLAIKDVLARKGLYLVMFLVIVISCFIMIVPRNISNTMRDPSIMTYMGFAECDLVLSVQLVDQIPEKTEQISGILSLDNEIEKYSVLTSWLFDISMADGSVGKLRVELGDHSVFPLTYSKGREPQQNNEIALSTLNADELGKNIGDTITLKVDGQDQELTVCGLYSDVSNGGMTAKAVLKAESENDLWGSLMVKLKDSSNADQKIAEYKAMFPYVKTAKVDDYLEQSLGTIIGVLAKLSSMVIVVGAMLTILITLLFMKMLVTKDRYQISVLKSLGFTSRSIMQQYIVRAGLVFVLGLVVGTIAANTLGELVGSALMSSFGVTTFHFKINVVFTYVISPLVISACVFAAARLGITGIKDIKVSEYIKE